MNKRKTTSAGQYRVPAGVVRQELWKGNTLYIGQNRGYSASGLKKFGKDSGIVYETGGGGSYRPCTHDKTDHGDPIKQGGFLQYGTPSNPALWGGVTNSICIGLHQYAVANCPEPSTLAGYTDSRSVSSIPWDELSAQAYNAMKPKINIDGLSYLNFLYELKDFKHLASSILGRLTKGRSAQSIWDAIFGYSNKKKHKKMTLRNLASTNLSVQFAWRPFAQDVWSLYKTATNFGKRFQQFRRRAGLPMSNHYTTIVSGTSLSEQTLWSGTFGVPGGYVGGYNPTCYCKIVRMSDTGILYTANMRYKYELPAEVNTAMGAMKLIMDALGVRPNPRIIWDAIPFSFLIDWVTNIGKLLERLSVDNLPIKVRISEFCHSAKRQMVMTTQTQQNWMKAGIPLVFPWQTVKTVKRSYYYRTVGMPNISGAFITRAPGRNQLALTASLVLTR